MSACIERASITRQNRFSYNVIYKEKCCVWRLSIKVTILRDGEMMIIIIHRQQQQLDEIKTINKRSTAQLVRS